MNLLRKILESPNGGAQRPIVSPQLESSIPGLFVVGDLAGAPVFKLAMQQGVRVADHISAQSDARAGQTNAWDVIVAGAGAAGLTCAMALQERGLRVLVLEKDRVASTIEDFPEGKWIYAEPESLPTEGRLWLEGATKEDLLDRWKRTLDEQRVSIRTGEGLIGLKKTAGGFLVTTTTGSFAARRVVLATGLRSNPRKLGVPGEEQPSIHYRLYSPGKYKDEDILVVGGGNSAVEAALALSIRNRVTLCYRGKEFLRVFRENERLLREAVTASRIKLLTESTVAEFRIRAAVVETREGREVLPFHHAFIHIGAEPPRAFLKSLGLKLENEWDGSPVPAAALLVAAFVGMWGFGSGTGGYWGLGASALACGAMAWLGWRGSRWAWLAFSLFLIYALFGIKRGPGNEFWPYKGWGAQALTFFNRPPGFWYGVLYTLLLTGFGIQALLRWGIRTGDRFQTYRFLSLIGFQWIFYFLVPEFLFRGVQDGWRSYGLVYAWPLFFHTFLGKPATFWIVWGVVLAFVLIPVFVLFHGKRYCSWICGCGGLAETVGDRWRHLAPKGWTSIKLEAMGAWVAVAAIVITAAVVSRDLWGVLQGGLAGNATTAALNLYGLVVDLWLVGLIPIAVYPFLGGKIWCRYWCPLAKLMEWQSRWFTSKGVSRFAITSNDKCISCGECTRYCQVGIDVMSFAMKQQTLNNANSSCIGCGICVTVCPMDVLSFNSESAKAELVQIANAR